MKSDQCFMLYLMVYLFSEFDEFKILVYGADPPPH